MSEPRPTFSLKALLLAPLPVSVLCGAVMSVGTGANNLILGFVLLFGLSLVVTGSGTFALAVVLWLLGRLGWSGRAVAAVSGVVLAGFAYLVVAWVMWKSSGPDSGPPEKPFLADLLRVEDLWLAAIFLLAGLVTALVYDALTQRFTRAKAPVAVTP